MQFNLKAFYLHVPYSINADVLIQRNGHMSGTFLILIGLNSVNVHWLNEVLLIGFKPIDILMLNMDDSHSYSNNIHKRLFDKSQTSKKTSHNKS